MTQQPSAEFETDAYEPEGRGAAIERLRAKRDLSSHVIVYLVVNAALVVIWAVTGAGYFWPVWIIAGWGVGLLLHMWEVFGHRPITEDDIQREMGRLHQ
jgi:hypothetical protein